MGIRNRKSVSVNGETFADVVDDALVHLAACDRREAKHHPSFSRTQVFFVWPGSPSDWEVLATPIHPNLAAKIISVSETHGYDASPRWVQPFGANTPSIQSTLSVDAAKAHMVAEDACLEEEAYAGEKADLAAMSPYLLREVRLLRKDEQAWRRFGDGHRFVAQLTHVSFRIDGKFSSFRTFVWWNGHEWTPTGSEPQDGSSGVVTDFALGFAAKRLGWWTARFHMAGASVDLPTDPSGARAIFSDRETGRSGRREALRHWVRAHSRVLRREDANDIAWVRSHLRGRTRFAWHGLDVELLPSAKDVVASQAGIAPDDLERLTSARTT